jgi:hypothetical protein
MTPEEHFNDLVERYVNKYCDGRRKADLMTFLSNPRIKEGLSICPASTSKAYHHCMESGLIIHIKQVIDIALCLKSCGEPLKDLSEESIVTTGILHDIHKVCDFEGRSYYVPNLLKSGKVSDAKPYKIGEVYAWVDVPMANPAPTPKEYFLAHAKVKPSGHLSLMTLLAYSQELYDGLTQDEIFTIIHHGGAYETSMYELAGKENKLQIIIHAADMLSSRYHEDAW